MTAAPLLQRTTDAAGSLSRRWAGLGGVLLVLLSLVGTAPPAHAQDAAPPRYTFALRGVPLETALLELTTTTHLDLSFDPALVDGKRTYCVADRESAENVLRCLLRGTGLDFYRLSSGLYVLTEVAEAPPRRGHLHGLVVDAETGEPLPNAHVLLADGSRGAVANTMGRFQFANLEPGAYRITTSYLGYHPRVDSIWVPPNGTAQTHLSMESEAILVEPVVIDGMAWRPASEDLGTGTFTAVTLLDAPNGGMPSVTQRLGTLVGVRLSDATADVHVQGGETGEHEFRLDGAPVFVPVSVGGLVGPFSPFALGRVTVHKTGFGAALGSQTAGVIEAEHALGTAAQQTLDVQADPLSANGRLGLSFGRSQSLHGTFLLAGRYGLWDVYTPPPVRRLFADWNQPDPFMLAAFSDLRTNGEQADALPSVFRRTASTGDPALGFHDLHGAVRLRLGALQSLHVSGYAGRRALDSERDIFEALAPAEAEAERDPTVAPPTRDLYVWNNTTAQARYEAVLSARLMASLQGRASFYRLRHDFAIQQQRDPADELAQAPLGPKDDDNNRIREYAVEARLDAAVRDGWHLEAGVAPTYTLSRFLVQGTQSLPIVHLSFGWRVASFVTNRVTLNRRATADFGARLTYLAVQDKVFAEPRLAFRYDHPGGALGPWAFRVAMGLYRQYVNQFDVSSRSARALSATSRMWMGVDDSVTPSQSAHLAAEWLLRPGNGWMLRLEGYYKRHLHLLAVDYTAGASTRAEAVPERGTAISSRLREKELGGRSSLPQSVFLADGDGMTYGSALLVEKQLGRARVEARYEYSRTERRVAPFYEGASVPAPWNEPHRLELAVDWTPADGLTLLARWRGIWNRTWGFRQSYYDFLGAYRNLSLFLRQPVDDAITEHVRAYSLAHPRQHKLPPVYQLDLSGAYTHRLAGVSVQTRLDLLNVLDRDNVADWRFVLDPDYFDQHHLLRRDERLLLPFTPSLALRVTW